MNKGTIITLVFLAFVASISIDLLWTGSKYQCEVCIKYKDQIVCQKVKGMAKEDTIMTGEADQTGRFSSYLRSCRKHGSCQFWIGWM